MSQPSVYGDSSRFVSILKNNVDEEDIASQGDEFESDVDERLVIGGEGGSESDGDGDGLGGGDLWGEGEGEGEDEVMRPDIVEDLVGPTARLAQFTKLLPINEVNLNSWCDDGIYPYENGCEFDKGQWFSDKKSLKEAVTIYNVDRHHMFKTHVSRSWEVVYTCARKPVACKWYLRKSMGRPQVVATRNVVAPCVDYPLGSQMNVGEDPLGCRWLRINRRYNDHKLSYVVYREILDMLTEDQFKWQPYTHDILHILPIRCREDPDEWIVIAPLICFYMVEYHYPDRVMRQFGWAQHVPNPCDTSVHLHRQDKRQHHSDYAATFRRYVDAWDVRKENMVVPSHPYIGPLTRADPYMIWYMEHTRRIISPQKASR